MQTETRLFRTRVTALWALLVVLACGCAVKAPTTQGDKNAPGATGGAGGTVQKVDDGVRRYALLVGVSTYDDQSGEFANLAYPEADVNGLAAALATGGYNQGDVVVMTVSAGRTDPKLSPTAANIRAQLSELLARCGPSDLVLVGFTGHGVELTPGQPHFCAYGCKTSDPMTLVSLGAVQKQMADSAAGTKILVSDACRVAGSKAPTGPRATAATDLPSVTSKSSTTMITYFSCKTGEFSWESDELKHGLFFAHLIDGLAGAADASGDGKVTWSKLAEYVDGKIAAHNEKFPARKQTPHFKGDILRAAPLAIRGVAPKSEPETAPKTDPAEKTVPVNATIASGDPRVEIVLLRVDLRNDRRMRWHFTFWNKTGKEMTYSVYPDKDVVYVTDDQGRRSNPLTSSTGQHSIHLPDGEKVNYWIDFQEPFPGARVITARFTASGKTLPTLVVSLAGAITPGAPTTGSGTLILRSGTKIRDGVDAWVEIDGKRVTGWAVGTSEVEIPVPAGNHRVSVLSVYQKKRSVVFDQMCTIPPSERTTIQVAP